MAAKKVHVVFGATGVQGNSVAKPILGDAKMSENWTVRGVTCDISKPSSKALESLGAETVAAVFNNASTSKTALQGAYAVFAVTNYCEAHSTDGEMKQGNAMADAAEEAGIQQFVWSSLIDVSERILMELLHFEIKAHIKQYFRDTGMPATFFMPGFYMSNLRGDVKLAMIGLSVPQCLAPHPFHSSTPPTMLATS